MFVRCCPKAAIDWRLLHVGFWLRLFAALAMFGSEARAQPAWQSSTTFEPTGAADDEPIPDTARSGRANAKISLSRWYKISVRSNVLRNYLRGVNQPKLARQAMRKQEAAGR
jgi:hypothetical protein